MMILEQNEVKLISIKTKSLHDLDNEFNYNDTTNPIESNTNLNRFPSKTKGFQKVTHISSEVKQQEREKDEDTDDYDDDDDNEDNDHYESSVRFIKINKSPNGACGFHLTRSKWDPYPWVSAIDEFTPAAKSDLKAGDCVLEVNGCDVLGLRITEIAKLVKSSQHQVTLLLWSTNCNTKCDEESLCAAPMPRSLQRLSLVVQTILSLIECPVCRDTITPPAMQCQNGHLLCVNCRIRAEKCPVCRDRYYPRPALIAEQIQSAITSAFNLCRNEDKVRQRIFGRHHRQRQMVKTTLECLQQDRQQNKQQQHKFLAIDLVEQQPKNCEKQTIDVKTTTKINRKSNRKITDKFFKCARSCSCNDYSNGVKGAVNKTTCNKFLTKLLNSKAYSMENVTNGHNNGSITTDNSFNTCPHTTLDSAISQTQLLDVNHKHEEEHKTLFKDLAPTLQHPEHQVNCQQFQTLSPSLSSSSSLTNTNQFNDFTRNHLHTHHSNHLHPHHSNLSLTHKAPLKAIENDLNIDTKLCCKQLPNNKMKHFSITPTSEQSSSSLVTNLTQNNQENITCLLESTGNKIFMNDKNKRRYYCPVEVVCETSYATIPRAIKLRDSPIYQNDGHSAVVQADKETTNFPKSYSLSMTSLNLNLTKSASTTSSRCSCCCTKSTLSSSSSSSSSSSVTQNCQSSLSASSALAASSTASTPILQ